MIVNLRQRAFLLLATLLIFASCMVFYLRTGITTTTIPIPIHSEPEETTKPTRSLKYKPQPTQIALPIVDNFPLAAAAHSASDLPSIPPWNLPPSPHVKENTPLFIGFTRNWRLLQQVVVSYITSGWPPEDIYVVENTGVLNSNKDSLLSLQNPFFLNHTRLNMLGVNVLVTPTLFTFAQLQNFYLYESVQRGWKTYFWSHMDVVAVSMEGEDDGGFKGEFKSIYTRCVEALRQVGGRWAMRFFSYDRLALVNVDAFLEVGGWDTMIPFYMTDCDMHARLDMAGFEITEVPAGLIYDVASTFDDLLVLYRKHGILPAWRDPNEIEEFLKGEAEIATKRDDIKSAEAAENNTSDPNSSAHEFLSHPSTLSSEKYISDTQNSPAFFTPLLQMLDRIQGSKWASSRGRNTWQARQTGGEGDPFYRDSQGFEIAIQMTIEHGRAVFREKWGHRDCDIVDMGLKQKDAWRVEKDWEEEKKWFV